jgi:hypothetical protein
MNTQKYDLTMIPDPNKPGWSRPRDWERMEADELERLEQYAALSDAELRRRRYGLFHTDPIIITDKTRARRKSLTERLQEIELAATAGPVAKTPAPRYTCRACGEHRDTTRPGHCDDCEG